MVNVYIKSTHDYKIILFASLIVLIYRAITHRQTATKENAKTRPFVLPDRLRLTRGCSLHGTVRRKSSGAR